MVDKRKKIFSGKNPYLFVSCAVAIASALLIFSLLREKVPAEEMGNMEVIQQTVEVEESQPISVEATTVETEVTEDVPAESTEEMVPQESMEETIAESETLETQETKAPLSDKEDLPEKEDPETVEETVLDETKATEEMPEEMEETKQPELPETQPSDEPEVIPKEDPEPVPEESAEEPQIPSVHEHSWSFESYYQKPTCSNGGLVNQICAHCGETQTTVGTPTGEHHFEVETPGDCCSAEVAICSECNHREVREKDPDNHIDEEDGFCYGCGQKTE